MFYCFKKHREMTYVSFTVRALGCTNEKTPKLLPDQSKNGIFKYTVRRVRRTALSKQKDILLGEKNAKTVLEDSNSS